MTVAALRTYFGLTQEMMASWLGVPRTSLALAERGHQSLTPTTGVQEARLSLAAQGLVYGDAGDSFPAPPALLPPPLDTKALAFRLQECRAKAQSVALQLAILRRRAAPYEARLAAAPALRAYPGPISSPEDEGIWLTHFEREALGQLRTTCGATAQWLLEGRLAGLEREAELLAEVLAAAS